MARGDPDASLPTRLPLGDMNDELVKDAAQGVAEDMTQDVAQDLLRGPGGARPHRHATTAAAVVLVQLALRWGTTNEHLASGGAAQSAPMFISSAARGMGAGTGADAANFRAGPSKGACGMCGKSDGKSKFLKCPGCKSTTLLRPPPQWGGWI